MEHLGDQPGDQFPDQRCPVLLQAQRAILTSGKEMRPKACEGRSCFQLGNADGIGVYTHGSLLPCEAREMPVPAGKINGSSTVEIHSIGSFPFQMSEPWVYMERI
jgi:hypothetical protein